jgi:hypothetical protein
MVFVLLHVTYVLYIPWRDFWILESYKSEVKLIKMYTTNYHYI